MSKKKKSNCVNLNGTTDGPFSLLFVSIHLSIFFFYYYELKTEMVHSFVQSRCVRNVLLSSI